jgi:site-specific DNA recombinase
MGAEMELSAIAERNKSTARRDIRLGKYRGSTPPWGYLPRKEGDEWRLVQDPEQVAIIREVVERVLRHEPLKRIADDLTGRGVLTVKDQMRRFYDQPAKGTGWSQIVLKRSLVSEAMLGYVISEGRVLRGDDGAPIQRSEPILTREVFERVRIELGSRGPKGERKSGGQSLLTGVLLCGVCGEPAYRFNGGSHSNLPRYRCRSITRKPSCGNRTVKLPEVDDRLEAGLLSLFGGFERKDRVWQSGSDNASELAEIDAELVDLTSQIASPAYRAGTPQRRALDDRIAALAQRQGQLSAEAVRPAGYEWVPTGERFADWWQGLDNTSRNDYLRSMNVRVTFDRDNISLHFGDLLGMLGGLDAGELAAKAQEVNDFGQQLGVVGYEIVDRNTVTMLLADGGRFTTTV